VPPAVAPGGAVRARRRWGLVGLLAAAVAALILTRGWREQLMQESAHYQAITRDAEVRLGTQREQAAAIRELEQQVRANPGDSETRLRLADLRWRQEGPAAAAAVLRAAPRPIADVNVARMLAHCARLAGREDLALAALNEAITRYPQVGSLRADRALLYTLLAWHQEAEREIRAAEATGAEETVLARAILARAKGDRAGARDLVERALARNPDDAELTRQLAAIAESAGQNDEAIRLWESLAGRDPGGSDRLEQAAAYLRKGDLPSLARAQELLDRLLVQRAGDARARFLHARCLRRLGRTAEARAELEALHRETPRMFGPAYELAEIDRAEGRAAEIPALLVEHSRIQQRRTAMRRAATTIMREPANAAAHAEVGRLCLESGLAGRAIVEFERTLQLNPRLTEAVNLLPQARAAAERGQVVTE
jgi:tetratricopeptide (TPR) repeat protein